MLNPPPPPPTPKVCQDKTPTILRKSYMVLFVIKIIKTYMNT